MEASIAFAPEAEHNPLAVWVAESLSERLSQGARRRDFVSLRAAVVLVAKDRRLSVTLRFDHGYLTIHDGMLGIPDVTFCGDYDVLTELPAIARGGWRRFPLLPRFGGRSAPWRQAAVQLMSGELKIYGLLTNLRTIVRLLRLFG